MRALLLIVASASLLSPGCTPLLAMAGNGQPMSEQMPAVSGICEKLNNTAYFDTALRAYAAATDAINLLIDAKVIAPGSPKAKTIADANDVILLGFQTAENARRACNATGYVEALRHVADAITDLRAGLRKGD